MGYKKLETEQKALEINLNNAVYGTFAEIGAGQEVARYFFQAGGSSGTIAKTMSAYDKTYSDAIYGLEESGRYVCEARIQKMLDREYGLMESRLRDERPEMCFFAYVNTIAAINYQRTIKGNGWMGLRFQLHPHQPANDLVLHVRMLDNDNKLQQDAIGILGVNMIHAAIYCHDDISLLLTSLMDDLDGRVFIDMVRLEGPDFKDLDHRILCLKMVELGLTDVAIFGPDGRSLQATEFLYKKSALIVRSRFRPVTALNWEMFEKGKTQFAADLGVEEQQVFILPEITLDDLRSGGEIDLEDYIHRISLLNAMGHVVVISNCLQHEKLINYLLDYKIKDVGFVMSIWHLKDIIHEKYEKNKDNQLLASFGAMFSSPVRIYAYPAIEEKSGELMTIHSIEIPVSMKHLYMHLIANEHLNDFASYNPETIKLYSKEVLRSLRIREKNWEKLVPPGTAELIKERKLFGFE